jgi:hypothetical protein
MKTRNEFFAFLFFFLFLLIIMLDRIHVNPRMVIWSDSEGYYKYLPGLFILKDFHQLEAGSIWPYYNDKGEYIDKYTCGIAYFELPTFLVAHAIDQLKRGIFR